MSVTVLIFLVIILMSVLYLIVWSNHNFRTVLWRMKDAEMETDRIRREYMRDLRWREIAKDEAKEKKNERNEHRNPPV